MKIIPLSKPYFSLKSKKSIINGMKKILDSGTLMMGKYTEVFEKNFSKKIGVQHSITTNTGTTALQIILNYYQVKGYEILVPSASFITDVSAIKWCGGTPVYVDINPKTLSFDLDKLEKSITKKTKCIIWVHLTGLISEDYKKILSICKKYNLKLIEDCSHAHGAKIDNHYAGSIGNASCFSFYPGKIMTSGTGGIITTNNKKLAEYAKQVRLFGRCKDNEKEICLEGNDWFMDEFRACIGYYQLKDLNKSLKIRKNLAQNYNNFLSDEKNLSLLKINKNNSHAYYQFSVFLNKKINREKLINKMKTKYGIISKRIYKPVHNEKIFNKIPVPKLGLKTTEDVLSRSLCLPMHCYLTKKDIKYICESLKSALK